MRQNATESFEDVASRIEKLYYLGNPGKLSPHLEALSVQTFLSSIIDRYLSLRVAESDPATLREALQKLLKLLAFQRAGSERSAMFPLSCARARAHGIST